MLRYVTLRYVNHSFKLSRLFYCKNLLKTFITRHYEGNARSNPKSKEFYRNLIASLLSVARNDKLKICNDNFNYIHAFSGALKNQFEIISRNENYAFNHNKNFCRNGNNQSLRGFSRSNLFSVDCHAWQYARFRALAMTNLQFATTKANMVYFLAMVMAEILFLIFGVILISAFYLIEKLIQKKF